MKWNYPFFYGFLFSKSLRDAKFKFRHKTQNISPFLTRNYTNSYFRSFPTMSTEATNLSRNLCIFIECLKFMRIFYFFVYSLWKVFKIFVTIFFFENMDIYLTPKKISSIWSFCIRQTIDGIVKTMKIKKQMYLSLSGFSSDFDEKQKKNLSPSACLV